jgi:Flp pilus assembly protein TadD
MKTQIIIALTFATLIGAFVGCGSSMSTIGAKKQTAEIEVSAPTNLGEGISLYQSGDYAEGEKFLGLAVKSDPTDWQAHYYLGLVHFELGQFRLASENLFRSLDLAPDDSRARADLYAALGQCWENLKKPGKARLHYHTALNLWPQCAQARDGLARLGAVSEADDR